MRCTLSESTDSHSKHVPEPELHQAIEGWRPLSTSTTTMRWLDHPAPYLIALPWKLTAFGTPPDRTVHQPGGLFGIGCRVATHPPHNVQKMNGLKDAAGDSVDEVNIGDTLLTVGDVMMEEWGRISFLPPPSSSSSFSFATAAAPASACSCSGSVQRPRA
jgi:hypothetical protein